MKVIKNDSRSLFDDFIVIESIDGGVVRYKHVTCDNYVKLNLRNNNLGYKLREIIVHYDQCHRRMPMKR